MGDLQLQISAFQQQLATQLGDAAFDALAQQVQQVIHPILLRQILEYVQTISSAKLETYAPAYGEMFLGKQLGFPFSFYVGRDYAGNFQVILTQNGKTAVGAPGKAAGMKKGSYKVGKPAQGFNLLTGKPEGFFRLTLQKSLHTVMNEMEFSTMVDSPYIARYFASAVYNQGDVDDKDKIALFLPRAEHGALNTHMQYIEDNNLKLAAHEAYCMIYCILAGMRHMHNTVHAQHTVRHRDIKPGNMLSYANGLIKYADFGGWNKKDLSIRTIAYCPPEYIQREAVLFSTKKYFNRSYAQTFWSAAKPEERAKWSTTTSGYKADVWGAGVSIYELMLNETINHSSLKKIKNLNFLRAMLAANPEKRCTSDAALQMFLSDFLKIQNPRLLSKWINQMLAFFSNDFQRTQFLSELHAANCNEMLNFMPVDETSPMPFGALLRQPTLLSISEWYRLRDMYAVFLSKEEMQEFDEKLEKRPEFDDGLVGASLLHAVRTDDMRVLEFIRNNWYDLGDYFKSLPEKKLKLLLTLGISPSMFIVSYDETAIHDFLGLPENKLLLMQLLEPQINIGDLKLVVEHMEQFNYKEHFSAVLAELLLQRKLKPEHLYALQNAGVGHVEICKRLVRLLGSDNGAIKYYFDQGIFAWIDISYAFELTTELHNVDAACRIAIYLLQTINTQPQNKQLLNKLTFDLSRLVEMLLSGENFHFASNYYFDELLSHGYDIWENADTSQQYWLEMATYGINYEYAGHYLTAKQIKIKSLTNLVQAQITLQTQSWKAVTISLLTKKAFKPEQALALIQAGVAKEDLLACVIPAHLHAVPVLIAANIDVEAYLRLQTANEYGVQKKIPKLLQLLRQSLSSSNLAAQKLLQQKIAYLDSIKYPTADGICSSGTRLPGLSTVRQLTHDDQIEALAYKIVLAQNEYELTQIATSNPRYLDIIVSQNNSNLQNNMKK